MKYHCYILQKIINVENIGNILNNMVNVLNLHFSYVPFQICYFKNVDFHTHTLVHSSRE